MKWINKHPGVLPARRRLFKAVLALCALALFPGMAIADGAHDDAHEFFLGVERDQGYWIGKLLERGFDPNVKETSRGDTGLILALREHSMAVFNVLLNAPKIDLDASSRNGDTALMIASFTGNQPAVKALLEKGAKVNKSGWTALHYAATIGDNDIIKLLIDKSADVNAESPNSTTPLMMAARSGQLAGAKLLVQAGADASLRNMQGMSAADFAKNNDHPDITKWLADLPQQAAGKH